MRHWNVRDVHGPDLVRPRDLDAAQQIRIDLVTGRGLGGARTAIERLDIRRPCSAFSVSEDIRSLSGLFLAPGLCIQKFRSRWLRFDGQYRSVNWE